MYLYNYKQLRLKAMIQNEYHCSERESKITQRIQHILHLKALQKSYLTDIHTGDTHKYIEV